MEPPYSPAATPPRPYVPIDRRTVAITGMCVAIATGAAFAAQFLTRLIGVVTNVAFYGRFSVDFVSPAQSIRSPLALLCVPMLGALVVGLMARYGSASIRGHGIPEVMEKVLFGESRIPARVLVLKPLSAAVAIGTGGPFGAEGPIIATGGALGSLTGQFLHVTNDERKTLLAAGAAAGMAATFGTPVSAVLLAIELLLFEYRPRSLIPVAIAATVATAIRIAFEGTAPIFALPPLQQPSGEALIVYALLGVVIGAFAAGITRVTYWIEDVFEHVGERLHVHWMWWPIAGAFCVGLVGIVEPRTLGVGYDNIVDALSGNLVGHALLILVMLKFISWAIYLGSGTSGGTMAPLFTIGGGLGAWFGSGVATYAPSLGVDPRMAGLVGMAAMFSGASHALLASVVMAFETTRQPVGLLPLVAGCTAAYLTALLISRNSIMTEKLARRGTSIRAEYSADHLAQIRVMETATANVITLSADDTLGEVRAWMGAGANGATHQGFPVLDARDRLVGVVTRRDIWNAQYDDAVPVRMTIARPPVVVYGDSTLRDAADHMVLEQVGRLAVVEQHDPQRLIGIISRSDILAAHTTRLQAAHHRRRIRRIPLYDHRARA
jgi:CIC family chloride channel protein